MTRNGTNRVNAVRTAIVDTDRTTIDETTTAAAVITTVNEVAVGTAKNPRIMMTDADMVVVVVGTIMATGAEATIGATTMIVETPTAVGAEVEIRLTAETMMTVEAGAIITKVGNMVVDVPTTIAVGKAIVEAVVVDTMEAVVEAGT